MAQFSYRELKGDRVQIFSGGNLVTTLAGVRAARFLDQVDKADVTTAQGVMARATGQFKFGNERTLRKR